MLVQHSQWFRFCRPLHTHCKKALCITDPTTNKLITYFLYLYWNVHNNRERNSLLYCCTNLCGITSMLMKIPTIPTWMTMANHETEGHISIETCTGLISGKFSVNHSLNIVYDMYVYIHIHISNLKCYCKQYVLGVSVQYWPMLLPFMLKANVISATWQQDTSIGWLDTSIGCNISYPYCKRRALRVQRLLFAF